VQGLGTEDQIHIGRPGQDRLALLAGHAATDADDQIGPFVLQYSFIWQPKVRM